MEEEQVNEPNPLFEYAQLPHTLSDSTQHDRQQRGTHDNNTDKLAYKTHAIPLKSF